MKGKLTTVLFYIRSFVFAQALARYVNNFYTNISRLLYIIVIFLFRVFKHRQVCNFFFVHTF